MTAEFFLFVIGVCAVALAIGISAFCPPLIIPLLVIFWLWKKSFRYM